MSDPDLSLGSPNDLDHRHEIELAQAVRIATIEECANFAWDYCFTLGAPHIADDLEDAIRALKEQK